MLYVVPIVTTKKIICRTYTKGKEKEKEIKHVITKYQPNTKDGSKEENEGQKKLQDPEKTKWQKQVHPYQELLYMQMD